MKMMRTSAVLFVTACVLFAPVRSVGAQDSPTDPMAELLTRLGEIEARIGYLQARHDSATGEDIELFAEQLARRWRDHHALLDRLVAETDKAREAGTARPDATERIRIALEREFAFVRRHLERVAGEIATIRETLPETSGDELLQLELRLAALNSDLDELIGAAADDIEWAGVVGADLGPDVALFDNRLEDRAATLAARIELFADQRAALVERFGWSGADSVAIGARLGALEEKMRGATASLQALVHVMDRRDLETAAYRRLLLESTGDLGLDVLDPDVVGGVVSDRLDSLRVWARDNAGGLLVKGATLLLVLFVFGLLARLARRIVDRILAASPVGTTELLRQLLVGMASKLTWLIALLVALSVLGVDVGPMLAGLGIAGFVLGFALQDTLSNFAAGLMIMFYHPFDAGDIVTAGGVQGKVQSVTLVSTVITTFDNQVMIVPNSKVWGDVINNVTAQDTRRVDLVFGIGYQDEADKAQRIMEEVLAEHPMVLDDPEPVVRLHQLADSSVNFVCRPWCRTDDYWTVYWDVTQTVKQRFDEEGVSIPFPQRDVHVYRHDDGTAEDVG